MNMYKCYCYIVQSLLFCSFKLHLDYPCLGENLFKFILKFCKYCNDKLFCNVLCFNKKLKKKKTNLVFWLFKMIGMMHYGMF